MTTSNPSGRQTPSSLSVITGGAETGTLEPEKTPHELLVERYESRTFTGAAVIGALPSPTWLIRGLLLKNSIATIYGQKGQGKTHYTLGMSLELARGGVWHGRKLIAAPVLYLVGEGSTSFVERLEAWQEFHKEPLPGLFHSAHIEPAPQLVEGDEMKAFAELVVRRFGSMASSGLIILDTFQTATVGLDEISARDMTVAIEALQGLRRATGSTVCPVHHAGKDLQKGQRGHSSLGASMETEIEITKQKGDLNVTAKLIKMRAAADGNERKYRLNLVQLAPTLDDKAEALVLELPAEMRSVPVLTESDSAGGPLIPRNEKLLMTMLESYDLADGLKRSDVQRELGLEKSQAGKVLKELRDKRYVTNESPSGQLSKVSYWLTDLGRSIAEGVRIRRAGHLVEQATSREEAF